MLIEASQCGAVLDLDSIIYPDRIPLETWLLCFPSYGFLLSIQPQNLAMVEKQFREKDVSCNVVGEITQSSQLILKSKKQSYLFWDFTIDKFIL
jgi:selenophosphate synthetase-related protein